MRRSPRVWSLVACVAWASCVWACGEKPGSGTKSGAASASSTAPASSSAAASASSAASATPPVAESPPPKADEKPRAYDMHVDTPWQVRHKGRKLPLQKGHATMAKLKAGNYGGIVYPIYIPDYLHDDHPTIKDADELFDTIDQIIAAHPDVLHSYMKGPTPEGKITAYMSIEGAGAFAEDITQIDRFIQRGVMLVGPVHFHDDDLATSATGKRSGGLTELGKKFCDRVYQQGALVDVSHMSDAGFADLVPIAKKYDAPIVATHSNARAIVKHNRNLTDEQLKIIAQTGGIAGLNFYEKYVDDKQRATVSDLVKHALHMIEVAGIDHVGIGSDFEGGDPARGLDDAGDMQNLVKALEKAGVKREDIHKIFSENFKRIVRWVQSHRPAK